MLFWLRVVLSITSSVYTVISGNPRSHAEYLVDSVNPVPKQVPRNCRNSKWSSLTWHLAHSASAFVTNQLIWISLNLGANSTWWGRTRKVWGRTRHKVGANSIGGERGAIRQYRRWRKSPSSAVSSSQFESAQNIAKTLKKACEKLKCQRTAKARLSETTPFLK